MYTTTNVNCMQFSESSQNLLPVNNSATYQNNPSSSSSTAGHLPSCIVIGCKNGFPNADVKYYQVPNINQLEAIENNISRQWYINTLREDLLDYILSNKAEKSPKELGSNFTKQPHYVCLEHFDEESFFLTEQGLQKNEQFTLKEDAVPSLFEIEVFQKMIAHQEQIASNQQKQISNPIPSNPSRTTQGTNFLSSLILNNDQPQNDINSIQHQTSQAIKSNSNSQKFQTVTPINGHSNLSSNKRVRMDPDTRAALIQRVPKAVKRTSCVPAYMPHQASSKPSVNPVAKAQKAVKHTMPRSMLNHKPDHHSNLANSLNQTKTQKNSKQTTLNSNIYLKDILPPPIMQSTKRPQPSVNKAVKHTGGGTHSYYQSLNQNKNHSPKTITPINTVNDTANKTQPKQVNPTTTATNKVTMTTTYVYKRISHQPEIDLNLECEEEDLVYVMPPSTPPRQSPVKEPEPELPTTNETFPNQSFRSDDSELDKLDDGAEILKQVNNTQAHSPAAISKKIKQIPRQKFTAKLDDDPKVTSTPPSLQQPVQLTKVLKKNVQITQVTPGGKQSLHKNGKSPALTAALIETEISDGSDLESSDFEENEEPDQMTTSLTTSEKRLILKHQLNTNIKSDSTSGLLDGASRSNSYANVLGKFYSRRHGSMASALEMAALEIEQAMTNTLSKLGKTQGSASPVNNLASKRSKQSQALATLPIDLRIGNYPAKCNICNLVLDNNIELTSHICSHLESSGSDPNAMTTYISPFDAVTTTCGVCDMTFQQPFDLIKHLDQKHMKQLGEYKCRICELQHSKLSDLVAHLNHMHVSQEMPYRCDACGFRTSFYADAIYHIKKEHKSTLRHFCPYCLKSLSLPYNEKLGYVQCQLFYSHLITHFNKHENDTLQPSKCKHCQKCILHVRYMKDHLASDHSMNCKPEATRQHLTVDSSISPNKCTAKIKKIEDGRSDIKALLRSSNVSKATDYIPNRIKKCEVTNPISIKREIKNEPEKLAVKAPITNLRKRRRSNRLDDDLTADTNSTNSKSSNLNSPANLYDFDDDIIDEKAIGDVKDELTESSTNDVIDSGRSKLFRKYTKGRKSVRGKATAVNKMNPSRLLENEIKLDAEIKCELEPRSEHETFSSPVKQPRKQKALKQTNVKTLSINSKYHNRRMLEVNRLDYTNTFYSSAPKSPEVITTVLAGNIKFNANKNNFKCVECGDCDLKTHFKNDYTCHQCKYNTNCSDSFEYHLHGHLVSKRIALWNKVLKIETEEYKCPCGFVINSTKDNSLNANTGNKVAAHLLKCEFKHCNVYLEEESKEEASESQANKEETSLPVVILNEATSLS